MSLIMFTFPSRTTALTITDWRHLEFRKYTREDYQLGFHLDQKALSKTNWLDAERESLFSNLFCVLCIIYLMK